MNSIPLCIMEEHHEAFWLWQYAIRQKLIEPDGNVLLHVDRHDDMQSPVLRTSVKELSSSLDNMARFTYDELGVATFILPAVYQHIFHEVYWCRPQKKAAVTSRNYLRSYQQAGKMFIIGPDPSPWPHKKSWQDRVSFTYYEIGPEARLELTLPVILDIDLDFFVRNVFQSERQRLEVTENEFRRFQEDKYHFLRLNYRCYAGEEDSGYYVYFYPELDRPIEYPGTASQEETILQKIQRFGVFLHKNDIRPVLIDLCRSRKSGYMPSDTWEFAEQELLRLLQGMYSVHITLLKKIIPNDMNDGLKN